MKKRLRLKLARAKNKFKETYTLNLNSQKSKKYLNWKTKIDFKKSINLTAEWYKKYLDKGDNRNITSSQIKNFLNYKND